MIFLLFAVMCLLLIKLCIMFELIIQNAAHKNIPDFNNSFKYRLYFFYMTLSCILILERMLLTK